VSPLSLLTINSVSGSSLLSMVKTSCPASHGAYRSMNNIFGLTYLIGVTTLQYIRQRAYV